MEHSDVNMPAAPNYLEQAKQFLKGGRLLRAAPLALLAVTALHAAPNFAAPTGVTVSECQASGGSSTVTPLSGAPVNSNRGISLFGAARMTVGFGAGYSDCLKMRWTGTGTGTFDAASLPLSWAFSITGNAPPAVTVSSWLMTVTLNSTATTFNCSGNCSGGSIAGSGTAATPGSAVALTAWTVLLQVNGIWNAPGGAFNVNVPGGTSIDINATLAPGGGAGVPALSNTMLALLAAALLAMGCGYLKRPNWGAPGR
jgi:hypothetical protein